MGEVCCGVVVGERGRNDRRLMVEPGRRGGLDLRRRRMGRRHCGLEGGARGGGASERRWGRDAASSGDEAGAAEAERVTWVDRRLVGPPSFDGAEASVRVAALRAEGNAAQRGGSEERRSALVTGDGDA